MRFVSLFAGIGGMDKGLEAAGWECVAQVENDPWCTRILEKHWPTIPKWGDIHDLDPADLPDCDAVVGGFPCQPVSLAGKRQAQDDPRWLWPEFLRIIRMVRPRIVLVENVPGLLTAGFGDVLDGLAGAGYDTEWTSVPAAAVGAPHLRWRIFIVAYTDTIGWDGGSGEQRQGRRGEPQNSSRDMGDTDKPSEDSFAQEGRSRGAIGESGWWDVEPRVGRVAPRVPRRVDRLRGLGNAVVPQVAEWIGRRIVARVGR